MTVPSFDHRTAGTAEHLWDEEYGAAGRTARLDDVGSVLVVAAHPDDESLGAAGLMNLASRRGVPITVLIATLGEGSHPDSPTHSPTTLSRLRRAEVIAAVAEVAPRARVDVLALPDGRLADHIPELTAAVHERIAGPDTLLVAPWAGDGHPDHAAAAASASAAAAPIGATVWHYPIWAWHWARPRDGFLPELQLLDLDRPAQQAKAAALGRHASQVRPLSEQIGDEAVLHGQFLTHFERDFEAFIAESPARQPISDRADRAAGLPATADAGLPAGAATSLPADFFDDFYSAGKDPWGFRTRWYEERKRAITLAALPRRRFRSAFEPGCAIGVLTEQLAPRCDRLLATDVADAPLREATQRLADQPQVRFERRQVPTDWPAGQFDLIVLSEVGYYCGTADLADLATRVGAGLTPDGVLVACHWRHPVAEYPQTGDEVHRVLLEHSGLQRLGGYLDLDFRLDILVPAPARSVAQLEGLAP